MGKNLAFETKACHILVENNCKFQQKNSKCFNYVKALKWLQIDQAKHIQYFACLKNTLIKWSLISA